MTGTNSTFVRPHRKQVGSGLTTTPTASNGDSRAARMASGATSESCPRSKLLRRHLTEFGQGPRGRAFYGVQGGELPTITYRRAWDTARSDALTAAEYASPLPKRPYDLRHACVSTWLSGGVSVTQVAEWAGHSVEVLLRVYAKCVEGQDKTPGDALRKPCATPTPDIRGSPVQVGDVNLGQAPARGWLGARYRAASTAREGAATEHRSATAMKPIVNLATSAPRSSAQRSIRHSMLAAMMTVGHSRETPALGTGSAKRLRACRAPHGY